MVYCLVYNGSGIRYVQGCDLSRNQCWTIVNIGNYLVLPILFIYLGCTTTRKSKALSLFGESLK
jgi:hypothetical protein